ncbi:MAG: hypothetical protein EBR82_02790, partial [Caulobacteraceae bacterium]|nr:hypothetical protein [Caulobacteraceae bacterium]
LFAGALFYIFQFALAWVHEAPAHMDVLKDLDSGRVQALARAITRLEALSEKAASLMAQTPGHNWPALQESGEQDAGVFDLEAFAAAVHERVTNAVQRGLDYYEAAPIYAGPQLSADQSDAMNAMWQQVLDSTARRVLGHLHPYEFVDSMPMTGFQRRATVELFEMKQVEKEFAAGLALEIRAASKKIRQTADAIRTASVLGITRVVGFDLLIPATAFLVAAAHYLGRDWGLHWLPSLVTIIDVLQGR